jgi:uncharacterized protein with PQ loop repeat
MNYQELAGWLPAIILPLSTLLQLIRVFQIRGKLQAEQLEGISLSAWLLFGVANVGAYIFTGQQDSLQAILAFLVTAIMDFVLVVVVLVKRSK